MKKTYFFILILQAICMLVFSQRQVKFYYNQKWKGVTSADSAAFYRIVNYDKDGKPTGHVTDYYITGEEQNYTDGAISIDSTDDSRSVFKGTSLGYYRSGKKQWEIVYNDDGLKLSSKGWYSSGEVKYITPYKNGKTNGDYMSYYSNGQVMFDIPYSDDSINGISKEYYRSGKLMSETKYVNGEMVDTGRTYYPSGSLNTIIPYINGKKNGKQIGYYESGKIKYYDTFHNDTTINSFIMYDTNGALKEEIPYVKGLSEGYVKEYWPNGTVKRKDKYANGEFMSGECFDSTGKQVPYYKSKLYQDPDQVYTIVQDMPTFIGDVNQYLSSHVHYPENERKHNITGTVYVNFIVEKDGSISNVKVLKGVENGPGLDQEAVRVISGMPKWSVGMQNGHAVRVSYNIPIRFVLN